MKGHRGFTIAFAVFAAMIPGRGQAQEAPLSASQAVQASTAASGVHLRMVIAAEIFEELGALADKQKKETVRCLLGVREGDRISINVAMQPHIEGASANEVSYAGCPDGTVALWHTHPVIRGMAPEYSCYLSGVDVEAAMQPGAPPVQMVQVRSGVMCWWIPRDFVGAGGAPLLLPRSNQRTGKPVDLATVECSGPARVLPMCATRQDAVGTTVVSASRVTALLRVAAPR